MVLLRRVIGDVLRARRQAQRRTLREVSTAANVSLGYLSEIERGQKEASSELLSAICEALGAAQSEVLRAASDTLAFAEQMDKMLVPMGGDGAPGVRPSGEKVPAAPADLAAMDATFTVDSMRPVDSRLPDVPPVADSEVAASLRRGTPLRTTLRPGHSSEARHVVRAA